MLKLSKITLEQDFSEDVDKIIYNLVKEGKTVSIIARESFHSEAILDYNSMMDVYHVGFYNASCLTLSNSAYNSMLDYNPSAIIVDLEDMAVINNKYELNILIRTAKELSDKGIEVYILVNENNYNEVSKVIG